MRKASRPKRALPIDVVAALGSSAVAQMNPRAKHPNIAPIEAKPGGALLLGAWPEPIDDKSGKHFEGRGGYRIRKRFDRLATKHELECGYDYICRTLPPNDREPTTVEIVAFRSDVEASIARSKPSMIVACGHRVVDWIFPGIGYSTTTHRGRKFRACIGGHTCWVFPIIGPQHSYLWERGDKDGSGEEYSRFTWQDLENAFEANAKATPPPELPRTKRELLGRYVTRISMTPSTVELDAFASIAGPSISVDIETRGTRPYQGGAAILSIAFCDGEFLLAMPVEHPEAPITGAQRSAIFEAIGRVLRGRTVVAHSAAFEIEWLQHATNGKAASMPLRWECTDVGAFTLDSRAGKSLDYLSLMYFGLSVKAMSTVKLWDERGALRDLLEYDALDAAIGFEIAVQQFEDLEAAGMLESYAFHMRRVVPLVDVQRLGIPCCSKTVHRLDIEYTAKLAELERVIEESPEVRQFEDRFGAFQPNSPDVVARMFADMLGRTECLRDGNRTSDASALKAIADDHPVAGYILDYRDVQKKLSTYIRRYTPGVKDSYVSPDGRVHCRYLTTRAQTRRLACVEPNNQNWPTRKGKKIRSIVDPGEGYTIVAGDLGQIEARVIGMLTNDQSVIRMFTEDYDVHMVWAERLARAYPSILKRRGLQSMDAWRKCVKNEFVFPCFFGAGAAKISKLTQIPREIITKELRVFWREFKAVRSWQKEQLEFYEEHGYVETVTGFRRDGPLNYNMVINTPIQNPASDICVEALIRCHNIAARTGENYFIPIMNIHDDLTFAVPNSQVDAFIPQLVRALIDMRDVFSFINVPLTCEIEKGPDWSRMEKVGTYRSDQLCQITL